MTLEEARLHTGFLVEELKLCLDTTELSALGIEITEHQNETSGAVWKVKLHRPRNREINFTVRPVETEGWGADFEILDQEGNVPLPNGYVTYLFSYMGWVFEQGTEEDLHAISEEVEELQWQNQTAGPE